MKTLASSASHCNAQLEDAPSGKTLSADLRNVTNPRVPVSPRLSFYSSSEFVFQYRPTPRVGSGSPWRLPLIAPASLFRCSSSPGRFQRAASRLRAAAGRASSSAGHSASERNEAEALLSHCDKSCSLAQPAAREGGEALLGRRREGSFLEGKASVGKKLRFHKGGFFSLIKPRSKKTG